MFADPYQKVCTTKVSSMSKIIMVPSTETTQDPRLTISTTVIWRDWVSSKIRRSFTTRIQEVRATSQIREYFNQASEFKPLQAEVFPFTRFD